MEPEESTLYNPSFIRHLNSLADSDVEGTRLLLQWQIEGLIEAIRFVLPLISDDEIRDESRGIIDAQIRSIKNLTPAIKGGLPHDMPTAFNSGTDMEGMKAIVRYSTWVSLLEHISTSPD